MAAATLLCLAPFLSAAEREPERHTVFIAVHPPYQANRARLRKMLKDEGHESAAEGEDEIVLVLTAARIEKLFRAKVRFQSVEKSASRGMTTQPTLEPGRIPARFEKLIRRIYFDPQRS